VAQLAAHPTCNRKVPGSSPGVGSDFQQLSGVLTSDRPLPLLSGDGEDAASQDGQVPTRVRVRTAQAAARSTVGVPTANGTSASQSVDLF
jgi:hypothetical protein